MQTNNTRDTFRVMLEIILVLGVLAVVSVIIVKIFFYADIFSKRAANISQALLQAESVSEELKSSNSFETTVKSLGMEALQNKGTTFYTIQYDKNWKEVTEKSSYMICVKLTSENIAPGILDHAVVTVYSSGSSSTDDIFLKEPLCSLNVSKYQSMVK